MKLNLKLLVLFHSMMLTQFNLFSFYLAEKYFEKKRLNETSNTFMKFPNDVKQAEELIGGDPNIVDDEQFQPKKAVPAQSK